MLKLTRLLILVFVAATVARPVMACCLLGHGGQAVADARIDTPSCHTEMPPSNETKSDAIDSERNPDDCPGCFDCDAAIMQAHTVNDGALLTQTTSEIPLVTLASHFTGFEHKPVEFKTGPPGDPPLLHHTPITLKQRLLI